MHHTRRGDSRRLSFGSNACRLRTSFGKLRLWVGAGLLLLALAFAAGPATSGVFRNGSPGGNTSSMAPVGPGSGVNSVPVGGARASVGSQTRVTVGHSVRHDVSAPLRSIKPLQPAPRTTVRELSEPESAGRAGKEKLPPVEDTVAQRTFGPAAFALLMPTPIRNFDGVGNRNGVYPPDTNGDVGPNHYVQIINLSFQIFNKSGVSLYGPANNNTLWSGFGGPCETQNSGDPIGLYDSIADRWLLSQFTSSAPYGECIAVSSSGDPLGSYYRYFFQFSTTLFYDYPHLGVWPDGYYMGTNRFQGNNFMGPAVTVFDRASMLNNLPATYQEIDPGDDSFLPSDLDGPLLPPAGSPNYFATRAGANNLKIYKFHVDWSVPANSTFTGPTVLPTAPFNELCPTTSSCVPQPGTTVGLDGLGDRLMHRLAYRNFGDHESLVTNHSVDLGTGQAAVRWYEIRNPSVPVIYQQGTYAPDTVNRWMGSVVMDAGGDMALGYSVSESSTVTYPGIRYTGRLAGDPLGTMPQGEATLMNGSGSQTGTASRWGDYSMMSVDPSDDCTFWFTTEYMPTTGGAPWQTRIGSFRFPSCQSPTPTPTVTGTPPTSTPTHTRTSTPSPTSTPCITLNGSITASDPIQTGRIGRNNIASTCLSPKLCPGALSEPTPLARHYDSYTFTNSSGSSQCVTVSLNASGCGASQILSVAYLNSYNPTNMCANYLADAGSSNTTTSYSFIVPAG
ncbi:MAG: hypothetical protein ACJ78Q_01475, partial [Chloroflexia bacterium]